MMMTMTMVMMMVAGITEKKMAILTYARQHDALMILGMSLFTDVHVTGVMMQITGLGACL